MKALLLIARTALETHFRGDRFRPDSSNPPLACFVSLKIGPHLRGCMGTLIPTKSCVEEEVVENALAAALRDPRFDPLEQKELARLSISIDLLSPLEPVDSVRELDPSRYGVIVRAGKKSGVLLPDLPGVGSAEKQIEICREKARISPQEPITLQRFTVERLSE